MFLWCYKWVDVICIGGVVPVLILVISLLSSWDEMDVRVELLAYNVWASKDDKIGFLNVGVDIYDRLY